MKGLDLFHRFVLASRPRRLPKRPHPLARGNGNAGDEPAPRTPTDGPLPLEGGAAAPLD